MSHRVATNTRELAFGFSQTPARGIRKYAYICIYLLCVCVCVKGCFFFYFGRLIENLGKIHFEVTIEVVQICSQVLNEIFVQKSREKFSDR